MSRTERALFSATGFTALPGVTDNSGTCSITRVKAGNYTGIYGTDFIVETSDTLVGAWTAKIVTPNFRGWYFRFQGRCRSSR